MLQYVTPETLTLKDVSIRNIKDENKGITRESLSVPEIQVAFGDKNPTLLAGWYFRKIAITHWTTGYYS